MMRGTKRLAFYGVAVITLLPLAACFEHTYHVGSGSAAGPVVYERWRNHWIGGLISPEQEMQLDDVCPSGNATIHQEQTFLNGLVGVLTGGIYVPRTVEVRCEGGRRGELTFDREDLTRIVSDPMFLEWVGTVLPERLDAVTQAQAALAQD